jgi:ATP-dependent Lon protease
LQKSRKTACVGKDKKNVTITDKNVETYLGIPHYEREKISENDIGVVTGLAWTEVGGETLTIEVNKMKARVCLILPDSLGTL